MVMQHFIFLFIMDIWTISIITNNVITICSQVFAWLHIFYSLNYMPKNGLSYIHKKLQISYENSRLTLLRNYKTLSKGTIPVDIPNNNMQGFQILHILTNTYLSFWL